MSLLLHRWTGKVLCHSEIIETAISTDLTSGQCEWNKYSIKALQACLDVQRWWGHQCVNLQ